MPRLVDCIPQRHTTDPGYWDQYLDGLARAFEHGTDFTCRPSQFATNARSAAKRRGLTVAIRIRGDVVYVQANVPVRSIRKAA